MPIRPSVVVATVLLIGALAACASGQPADTPDPPPPDVCDIARHATWPACDGTVVTLRGHKPKVVHQHPIVAAPAGPTGGGLGGGVSLGESQDYLDVAGAGQVILISTSGVRCEAGIEAKGKLERIALGGEPGTKGSYEGWVLRVDESSCFD